MTSADIKNLGYTHRDPRPSTGAPGKTTPANWMQGTNIRCRVFSPNFSTKIQTEINTKLPVQHHVRTHEGS